MFKLQFIMVICLTSITVHVLPAADTGLHKKAILLHISSYADLTKKLMEALGEGHDWRRTVVGFDFDETLVRPVLDLPCNKKIDQLLSGELKTVDNVIYERGVKALNLLKLNEWDSLAAVAYERGGYYKLKKREQEKNYAQFIKTMQENGQERNPQVQMLAARCFPYAVHQRLSDAIKDDIKANQRYEYMEPLNIIKDAVKKLQMAGAFVGICSVGESNEQRQEVQKSVGIKAEHWVRGENKFKRLLEMAKQLSANRLDPSAGDYDTCILIDNFRQGTIDFAKSAEQAGLIGVGVHYDSIDNSITTESLIKEFKEIACENQGESAPALWQSAWEVFGY